MSWFSRGGGEAPATSSAGGAFGGAGSSRWINMDTNQIKNFGGELTGENDAFSKTFGIELTRQQRIMGFVGCLIAGFVLSLLGTLLLITGSLATFAVLYSIGVVISLTGTGFLLGFMKQFKQMFAKVRIAFTAVMIVAFIMVWISAFAIDSTVLAIVFVIVLYVAFLLYSLSYIPWCIDFLKRMASKLF
ncbi:SFT2-domain-containing protein [Testicularia cyperi]|uniref:Protein transport protein SFT2 n=1 Tax=Testicularia cyperi TaxID=1882483 RepID=A0A317XJR8_9BASI|nr:SFT2-domain-containing protein [Testicularia cyperi]